MGLYAAAYSSAITIPLGAALTAQQIFLEGRYAGSTGSSSGAANLDDSTEEEDGHVAGDVDGEEEAGYNTRLVRSAGGGPAPGTDHT